MVKTVTLNGAETRVDSLGGQNVIVQNLGANTIHASINPNIVPGADNVIEIPAGGGVNVYGANGTIYLMGTGKVQCTGTDYSTVNFKMPSSSASGGGGDKPSGEMPVMTGIDIFDLYEPFKAYPAGSYDDLECPFPLILYLVTAGMTNHGTLLERSFLDNGPNYGLAFGMTNGKFVGGSGRVSGTITSSISTNTTYCGVLVSHSDGGLSYYANGVLVGTISGDTRNTDAYLGGININGYWRNWGVSSDGAAQAMLAMAIGHEEHTSEQIIQNSQWLMQKYGIGGG